MKPPALLLLLVGSVGLIGYSVHLLRERTAVNAPQAAPTDSEGAAKPPPDPRFARPTYEGDSARDTLAIALRSRLQTAIEAPEEVPLLPTPESRVEAETGFEVIMERIEGLVDDDVAVSKRRRKRLYRAANDAFSAYSEHLDPSDSRDMEALENAHVRLKVMLDEVGAGPPGS